MSDEGLTISAMAPIVPSAPRNVEWAPQADITAFELARAFNVLAAMLSRQFGGEQIASALDGHPPEVRRHFRVF